MPDLSLEQGLHRRGLRLIAGVDEAGRGPLAGPVVAAAVILKPGSVLPGIDDSKKLKPEQRLKFRELTPRYALHDIKTKNHFHRSDTKHVQYHTRSKTPHCLGP